MNRIKPLFLSLLVCVLAAPAEIFAGSDEPKKSRIEGLHEVIRKNDRIFIVDYQGEHWDVTTAVTKHGMKPEYFQYGLGRHAFTPVMKPKLRSQPKGEDPLVFGVKREGVARAYDRKVLRKHETLMDCIKGEPIMVAHCHLADLAGFYERKVDGRALTFVASGWTYHNGDHHTFVLYDRQTDSLWFPFSGDAYFTAVAGPLEGNRLNEIEPMERTRFSDWHEKHPKTKYAR